MSGVPTWKPEGRLMFFPWLDGSGSCLPVYTIGWRIVDEPDVWTYRFLNFKANEVADVRGGTLVLREAVREIITRRRLAPAQTGLSIALASDKTEAERDSPLFFAGGIVARQLGTKWLPFLFTKETHRSLHGLPSAAERDAEVFKKYRCGNNPLIHTLIILDDFVTRGSTFEEMVRALRESNPRVAPIGLALGKNERAAYARQYSVEVSNSHIPDEWDTLWRQGRG